MKVEKELTFIVGRNLLSIWGVFGSGISLLELWGILYVSVWFPKYKSWFLTRVRHMRDVFLMLVDCFREVL